MGTVISACYSQSKDELIIRFETHSEPFHIKASLESSFSCLSFPNVFHRARKNSIDLFPGIIGHRVMSIRQFKNERSFALCLDEGKSLLFKMHGNRSNLVLFHGNTATELFKNNYPGDAALTIDTLDRSIDWSYEAFETHQNKLENLYFTFGKVVWANLHEQDFNSQPIERKWALVQEVLAKLNDPVYYIIELKGTLHLSLLEAGKTLTQIDHPIPAANEFFHAFTHDFALSREKAALLSTLKAKLQSSENYYHKTFQKLAEIESDTNYKTWADLLMANLHILKQGMTKISLPDFYNPEQLTEIKLKTDLTPQKNAALFYKKAKNQHIEIERLQDALTGKEKEIKKLKDVLEAVTHINDLKTLRRKTETLGFQGAKEKQPETTPYHEFIKNGFRIWVGKNARSNDELTFKYSYKEDLWLHAKDVSGSHVLIKYQAGKKFPKDVIERAAQLAAYNSKRKTESLCPVMVTPKKFVRKRKGDPAGAVVVEREEVMMVEPRLE